MRNQSPTVIALHPRRASRAARAGLSLVEVLIALSITAMLLTAVAAAFSASAKAIEVNDQFFRATQAARVSVNRVVSDLRRCDHGRVYGTNVLEITSTTGSTHSYTFDAVNQRLTLTQGIAPDITVSQLASNVESCSFYTDNSSVGMNIIVTVGNNKIALSGSAIPRRRMVYE
jgi:prepilin-type N-terminal cleavage/methylation domain-containing protein